jgi:hypothetical protein
MRSDPRFSAARFLDWRRCALLRFFVTRDDEQQQQQQQQQQSTLHIRVGGGTALTIAGLARSTAHERALDHLERHLIVDLCPHGRIFDRLVGLVRARAVAERLLLVVLGHELFKQADDRLRGRRDCEGGRGEVRLLSLSLSHTHTPALMLPMRGAGTRGRVPFGGKWATTLPVSPSTTHLW